MITRHLRHLAVITLLCVLPRLGATVVQTFTVSDSDGGIAASSLNLTAPFFRYSGAEPLTSIHVAITFTGTFSVYEQNPFGIPWNGNFLTPDDQRGPIDWTPSVNVNATAFLASGQLGAVFLDPSPFSMAQSGPTVSIPWHESAFYSASFSTSSNTILTNPADLSLFTGIGQSNVGLLLNGPSSPFFGGNSASGTATFTIIYNAPANEEIFLLLPIALLAIGSLHRISRRFNSQGITSV